jgi:transposase-like protein
MALEMLIIVNEVTINRSVEPSSEVFSKVASERARSRPDALRERAETEIAILGPRSNSRRART